MGLGQVCHIVQLAIVKKKVLGYRNGHIVSYGRSHSMAKEQSALSQLACGSLGQGSSELPLATWDVARSCLQDLLAAASCDGRPASVALSRVKGLFQMSCGVELSETKLGYTKLSDLFQDERFFDICSVQLEESGYVVVQHLEPDLLGGFAKNRRSAIRAQESAAKTDSVPLLKRVGFCPVEPLSLFDAGSPECSSTRIKNTFIHVTPIASTPLFGARRRSSSAPRGLAVAVDEPLPALVSTPYSPAMTASPRSNASPVGTGRT